MNKSKQLGNLQKRNQTSNTNKPKNYQWRVWAGLFAVIFVSVMNWQWVWGILFLFWVVPDIQNKVTYFVEPVYRNENALLYWVIITTWVALSLLSFSTLFFDLNS